MKYPMFTWRHRAEKRRSYQQESDTVGNCRALAEAIFHWENTRSTLKLHTQQSIASEIKLSTRK